MACPWRTLTLVDLQMPDTCARSSKVVGQDYQTNIPFFIAISSEIRLDKLESSDSIHGINGRRRSARASKSIIRYNTS